MQVFRVSVVLVFLAFPIISNAQTEISGMLGTGSDLCMHDSLPLSLRIIEEEFVSGSEVVFCPAGIRRSSTNDVKKRQSFDWSAKYNSIYFRNSSGLVFEGMNEHGFSASLMYLDNGRLPEKEKHLIPIAASLAVNFFIDHFKCIDTALLAVWDIRIFNDLNLDDGWPFRIVLHDTTGSTAYIEYVGGSRQVYTPDQPAFIISGTEYAQLLKLAYIPEELTESKAEMLYLDIVNSSYPPNTILILLQAYMKYFGNKPYYTFFRYPIDHEVNILTPDNVEAVFNFKDVDFIPGKEVSARYF